MADPIHSVKPFEATALHVLAEVTDLLTEAIGILRDASVHGYIKPRDALDQLAPRLDAARSRLRTVRELMA